MPTSTRLRDLELNSFGALRNGSKKQIPGRLSVTRDFLPSLDRTGFVNSPNYLATENAPSEFLNLGFLEP